MNRDLRIIFTIISFITITNTIEAQFLGIHKKKSNMDSYTYRYDTLQINNDSLFINRTAYKNKDLHSIQGLIFIPTQIEIDRRFIGKKLVPGYNLISHGNYIEYFNNGQIRKESKWEYGEIIDDWEYYDSDGNKMDYDYYKSLTHKIIGHYYIGGQINNTYNK